MRPYSNLEQKRVRISSQDVDERERLSALGYFIESGDGQYLVMRLDFPAGLVAQKTASGG